MTVLNGMNDNNLGVFAVLMVLAVGAAVGFANGAEALHQLAHLRMTGRVSRGAANACQSRNVLSE